MKRLLLFCSIFFTYSVSFSQTATIFGTVKDSLNHPIFGANVAVMGKPIGATTDEAGKYSLRVPANEPLKIVFTYTGLHRDSVIATLKENEKREISRKLLERN